MLMGSLEKPQQFHKIGRTAFGATFGDRQQQRLLPYSPQMNETNDELTGMQTDNVPEDRLRRNGHRLVQWQTKQHEYPYFKRFVGLMHFAKGMGMEN